MLFRIIGVIGLVLIIYGLLIKRERKRYAMFGVGGLGLLLYSLHIGDLIFIILQLAFTIVSFIDYRKSKRRHPWRR